jgi:hypothetical protein
MAWSLIDPRAFPIIVAMSAGQLFGTLAFVSFLAVVAAEMRRTRFGAEFGAAPKSMPPPPVK